jgi:TRAP-type mannitol/chloroaromatic compound transport system permease small subunit
MWNLLKKYVRAIDWLNERVGQVLMWLTTLLVLLFCYDVVNRYVFNYSNPAIFELEWHLFALIFLLGAAYTLRHDRHVRVDVFYARWSPQTQAWINLLGGLLFLVPFCIVVIRAGIPYVHNSWLMNERSSDPGGLPARYLIKSTIIIGFVLLLLQATSLIARSLLVLGKQVPTSEAPENA